jgi:hypothetical protein
MIPLAFLLDGAEHEAEAASGARLAFHPDAAIMLVHNRLDDSQPQARTSDVPGLL